MLAAIEIAAASFSEHLSAEPQCLKRGVGRNHEAEEAQIAQRLGLQTHPAHFPPFLGCFTQPAERTKQSLCLLKPVLLSLQLRIY